MGNVMHSARGCGCYVFSTMYGLRVFIANNDNDNLRECYVCMYTCMFVCKQICMYLCTGLYVCMQVCTNVCEHVCTQDVKTHMPTA
jgi:hypothetical protein